MLARAPGPEKAEKAKDEAPHDNGRYAGYNGWFGDDVAMPGFRSVFRDMAQELGAFGRLY